MDKKIIFINSHPIQYFAPMYKRMNEMGLKTICWYCSDKSEKGGFDNQFGVNVKWDIPLLEGYEFKFFKNYSWKPSHFNGFFGLINLGMLKELLRIPKSVIVVHGWHYFSLFILLMMGRFMGHTVCLRCDVPLSHEIMKEGWAQKIKRLILKLVLFPRISYFLYIGEQNRLFYKSYNIPNTKLISCPYAVDNERFQHEYSNLKNDKNKIKRIMGIPESGKIIVYSAKYIPKKRPLDILKAFAQLNNENIWLIMVGEGELRKEMELLIKSQKIKNVMFTGFVNQSKISEYYVIADLFVMCSGLGENWGLSVNEAMNFNLPLILSDLSGCSDDLVIQGVNGFTFKTGDIEDLASTIKQILLNNALTKQTSSINIIENYSYDIIAQNMKSLLEQ